jgi:hypothetical protein
MATATLLDTVTPPIKSYQGPTWATMARELRVAGKAHTNPAGVVKVDVGFVGGKLTFPTLEFPELTLAQHNALITDLFSNSVLYLVLPDTAIIYTCVFVGKIEDLPEMHGDGTVVYTIKITGLMAK